MHLNILQMSNYCQIVATQGALRMSGFVFLYHKSRGGTTLDGLNGQFFCSFFNSFFCFVVAIFDLVHDVKAIYGLY